MNQFKQKTIVALDFDSTKQTLDFVQKIQNEVLWLKIGMELFYATQGSIVEELKNLGYKIFLDLKLHDIPTTVSKSLAALSKYKIDLINIHAQGGFEMMKAASLSIKQHAPETKLISVTLLTSLDQNALNQIYSGIEFNKTALNLAKLSMEAGLDGVVCPATMAKSIKEITNSEFLTVSPGIRLLSGHNDQKQVMTPAMALKEKVDMMVIGREITHAEDPINAILKIKENINGCN